MTTYKELQQQITEFSGERNWGQYHSPKNLSMALSVEASELVELFQWKTEQQSDELDRNELQLVADEMADVQIYLLQLAARLNIDITSAVVAKMKKNSLKYPRSGTTLAPSSRANRD